MTQYSIFDQVLPAGTSVGGPDSLDLGVQWGITASGYALYGYWFYVPAGGDTAGADYSFRLYSTTNGTSGTLISGSTVSGSGTWTAGTWVHTALSPIVPLVNGTVYVAAVTLNGEYQSLAFFWSTGGGSGNIVNGPVTAFAAVNAFNNAQQPFNEPSTGGFPASVFHSSFYGLDIDVGPASTPHTATAALTVTPAFTAQPQHGRYRTAALTVTPSFSAIRQRGKHRTASLTVTPSFSASGLHIHGRTAGLIVPPTFSAARTIMHARHAALTVTPGFTVTWTGGAPRVAPQTGSWWGLDSVFKQSREEFQEYRSRPPVACPVCGEPLVKAPATRSGSGVELYCPFAGDHQFHYPGDWVPPSRPWY